MRARTMLITLGLACAAMGSPGGPVRLVGARHVPVLEVNLPTTEGPVKVAVGGERGAYVAVEIVVAGAGAGPTAWQVEGIRLRGEDEASYPLAVLAPFSLEEATLIPTQEGSVWEPFERRREAGYVGLRRDGPGAPLLLLVDGQATSLLLVFDVPADETTFELELPELDEPLGVTVVDEGARP